MEMLLINYYHYYYCYYHYIIIIKAHLYTILAPWFTYGLDWCHIGKTVFSCF